MWALVDGSVIMSQNHQGKRLVIDRKIYLRRLNLEPSLVLLQALMILN